MKLKGKNTIITGGTGGIGKTITSHFLREGARVLIVARRASELETARKEFKSYGESLLTEVCDVSIAKDVRSLGEKIDKHFDGKMDVLINAAGIYGPKDLLENTEEEKWLDAILVNLYGTMLMTRIVLPQMKEKKDGVIINFSGGGEGAFPRFSAYVASKGGVVRFTETLAKEVEDFGIRINAIAPGAVNTKFLDEAISAGPEKVGEDNFKKFLKQKEEGGASPDSAAELCVFLASGDSAKLSGRVFSAIWDDKEKIFRHESEVMNTDIYTYRRIKPKDRGHEW